VLTGGCSNLEGLPELVEHVFNLPSRRGFPVGVGGLVDVVNNPIYATGVGLLVYGFRNAKGRGRTYGSRGTSFKKFFTGQALLNRMREWFKEIF
jgi:cell division protein FtsA